MYLRSKKSKFRIFIILILGSISSGIADYIKTTDQIAIVGDVHDSSIVNFLADVVQERRQEYETFFNGGLAGTITIHLTESETSFFRLAATQIPDWSGAVAFPEQRKILLKPGSFFDPDGYRETILHELAHIYISDNFKSRHIPLWMIEGCAMHLSKTTLSWNEMIILGNAFAREQVTGLEAIDGLLQFGSVRARLAYLESFSAVRFLVEKRGNEMFCAVMGDFSGEKNIDQIFVEHLGITLSEFEDEWYLSMRERYKWVMFLQVENLIWISLTLIGIAAFIIIKIRNRRIVRNWQETDDHT